MDKGKAIDSAKAFLEGLKKRPRQPWDDLAEDKGEQESHPEPPSPRAPATQPADEAMDQAGRLAARNRMFDKKTRYLRKD